MRQNFSYILCAIFMLFGTNQIIHGAAALAKGAAGIVDDLTRVLTKGGRVAAGVSDDILRGASKHIDDMADDIVRNMSQGAVLDVVAATAAKSAAIKSIIGDIAALPDFSRVLKVGGSDFVPEFKGRIGAKAQTGATQAITDTNALLRARGTLGTGKIKLPKADILPPKIITDFDVLKGIVGDGKYLDAAGYAGHSVAKNTKAALDFVDSSLVSVGKGLEGGISSAGKGIKNVAESAANTKVGKIALGKPKVDIEISVTKRGVGKPDVEGTYESFAIKPKVSEADELLITKDTIFDVKTRQPIKNPEPMPEGLGKFAKSSDPAYPRNADESFQKVKGEWKGKSVTADGKTVIDPNPTIIDDFAPAPKTTKEVPVLDANGKPVNWGLKDVVGDTPLIKFLASGLKKVLGGVKDIAFQGMIMGMAMSIPNSLMAGFTADKLLQAQLATIAAPIRFGGMVMQIPDELINLNKPLESLKIYVGVPVASITSKIGGGGSSPSVQNMVVGPDVSNQTSQVIASMAKDQFKAFMTTMMSAANQMETASEASNIPRYTFFQGDSTSASYYDTAHLFCSYSLQYWSPWASSAITDPGFSGLMVDLNTGYVCAADGTNQGNDPAVLLGDGPNGATSVADFLSKYASTLAAANKTFDYAQYTSGGQPDVDVHAGGSLIRQFSSACISNLPTDKPAGGANSGFGDICMVGNFRNSILATSLMRLAAGVCIGSDGKEIVLAPPVLSRSSSQEQYVDTSWEAYAEAQLAKAQAGLKDKFSMIAKAAGGGIRSGSEEASKAIVGRLKNEVDVVAQLLNATAVTSAAKITAAKTAKAATEAQIAGFYEDPNQKTNFAMQSMYVPDQTTFANDMYSKFTPAQQNLFATFALEQATSDQQQAFIDTVYNRLSVAQRGAFAAQLATFKDNASILLYVFKQATAAQQKSFLDTVFNSLTPMQKRAFIQDPQFVTTAQLQTFVNEVFSKADNYDTSIFAENVLAVVNQSQNQQKASAGGASGTAAYQVLKGTDAGQVLKDAIAKGALGGVVPIYGFDKDFQKFIATHFATAAAQIQAAGGLQMKTFGRQTAASQMKGLSSGSMQSGVSVGADSATSGMLDMQGGSNLNYPALRVYIYQCENTPFATELARLTSTQALDYIVFFDANLNCVPLQVIAPSSHSAKFNFPEYRLNPEIKYWASLICYIGEGNGPLNEFMGRYQDTSGVMQTFFPLYTMSGDLAYVEGATNAMDAVIASIQKPNKDIPDTANIADLFNQIIALAKLEVATYQFGPFYKPYKLVQADRKMWMSKASTNASTGADSNIEVVPYIGMSPYPMTLDLGSNSGPTDYLIPFVKDGGKSITVELPNPYVEMFVSLVTDIMFTVNVDKDTGMASFVPTSYAYSAYNSTTGLNAAKTSTYTWLDNFKNSGVTIPQALIDDVKVQRAAWVKFVNSNKNDPTFKTQSQGFPFGQKYTLTIANSDDYANGVYMYVCLPSPSGIADDVYVMAEKAALPDATVGLIANAATPQPYIVSMATGFMYDNKGNVVKSSAGKPVYMDSNQLLGLVTKNQGGKPLSVATQAHLKQIILEGQKILNALQGPYVFGDLVLHLYKIDIENSNYVYFALNQLGNPSDHFVVVKSAKPPFVFGGSIDGATQSMVSLITGQLYTRTGTAGTWPDLDTLLSAVKSTMSISAADDAEIKKLNAAFRAQRSAEDIEKSDVDKRVAAAKDQILGDLGNTAANIIAKLPDSYLPDPYDSLVKDTLGKYYRVTPGSDGEPSMIFDFKAASKDGSDIGAVFMANGTFVTIMEGIQLAGMRQQFGVYVDPTNGAQKLTIPHICGNMGLSAADQKIVPGLSGTALLVSTDEQFPTPGVSKIVSGTKTYYFYYHTFLHSYFVYVVDSASKEQYYISMNDGTAYNSDGSARILRYQVARGTKGDPMIIAQAADGMLSATFADPGESSKSVPGKYMNFLSDLGQFQVLEDDSYRPKQGMYGINIAYGTVAPHNPVYIYQDFPDQPGNMKFNKNAQVYLLHYADGTLCEAFTLEAASQVQALVYVPISKSGGIITAPVTDLLKSVAFILKQDSISEVIFNGVWYKASAGETFTSASGGAINVKATPATQSCAAYAVISQGANDYVYSYAYQTLSDDDFTQYKETVWLMNAAMSPMAKAVLCENFNPAAGKPIAVGKDKATNAVPSNVKNVPDSLVSGITVDIKSIRFDQATGKYFVPIAAADYDYFGQDGFVDIENGCIYDIKGIPYGYSLVLPDYVALLQKLNVMVVWDINLKRYNIVYRSGQLVKQQTGVAPAPKK